VFYFFIPMKAMVFAAGLGTRLRPLTDTLPKALVPVGGKPMLAHVIQRLKSFGVTEIVINVHHFADLIIQFVQRQQNFGITIHISDERDLLLDTGGGLKYAARFFDDGQPFLVHNVDTLTDLDLGDLYHTHLQSTALATLAVKRRPGSRFLLFDQKQTLCGWKNTASGEVKMSRPMPETDLIPLAFSGIHVLDPRIFALMPSQRIFSMTPFYLDIASRHSIMAYRHDDSLWLDIGKKDSLARAEEILARMYGG
jgi:NDP-sugar pyrophosphorylase family protein